MSTLIFTACSGATNETIPNDIEISIDVAEEPEGIIEDEQPSIVDQNYYEIGEMAVLGEWEITLNSFDFINRIDGGIGFFTPEEDNTYLHADITATNLETSPASFTSSFGSSFNN